jgi:hypothetical protein
MFARVATYSGDPEELVRGFDRSLKELAKLEGFSHAYFGVDRSSGRAMSMTLWATEATLEGSAEPTQRLRSQAAEPSGATIDSVTHYEIALTA